MYWLAWLVQGVTFLISFAFSLDYFEKGSPDFGWATRLAQIVPRAMSPDSNLQRSDKLHPSIPIWWVLRVTLIGLTHCLTLLSTPLLSYSGPNQNKPLEFLSVCQWKASHRCCAHTGEQITQGHEYREYRTRSLGAILKSAYHIWFYFFKKEEKKGIFLWKL